MPYNELTSQDLTRRSYLHSQGHMGIQRFIFSYVYQTEGVLPDLEPDDSEIGFYVRFLEGHDPAKPSHVDVADPVVPMQDTVSINFTRLRSELKEYPDTYVHPLDYVVKNLGREIILRENMLFDTRVPWTDSLGYDWGRQARLAARVNEGRPSLLFFHGRDGQTTGNRVFDALYRDVWATLADPDKLDDLDRKLYDQHAGLIAHAVATRTAAGASALSGTA